MNTITIAIIALISGALGSLIAPWVKWGIEKKKIKLQEKRDTLLQIRELVIEEYTKFDRLTKKWIDEGKHKEKEFKIYPRAITYYDTLNKHAIFQKIKPFLQDNTIEVLKRSELLKFKDRGTTLGQLPTPYEKLMDDLAKIERDWDLI